MIPPSRPASVPLILPRRLASIPLLMLLAAILLGCGEERAGRATDPADTAGAADPASSLTPRPSESDAAAPPAGSSGDTAMDASSGLPEWAERAWTASGAETMTTQVGVRAARHQGYDRITFIFSDSVPDHAVRYAEARPNQCGSGRPVELDAPAYLTVTLEPARAHNQRGEPTVRDRAIEPQLPRIRGAVLSCDFEGRVEWVLGLEQRRPLRVFRLDSPARLVVDVQS